MLHGTIKTLIIEVSLAEDDDGSLLQRQSMRFSLSEHLKGRNAREIMERLRVALELDAESPTPLRLGSRPDRPPSPAEALATSSPPVVGVLQPLNAETAEAIPIRGETIGGRARRCDVILPSSKASRRHFRVFPANDAIVIEDLGSANNTFVNGEIVVARHPLQDGDVISAGEIEMRFRHVRRAAH